VDDKGVDVALEAKLPFRAPKKGGEEVSEQFTSCRAQAQIKSTDSTKQNQDGSVSYQIEVSNLNHATLRESEHHLWVRLEEREGNPPVLKVLSL
jgi:hypothetical protein